MADFHSLKIESVFRALKTERLGLAAAEVEKRVKKYGLNELPKEKRTGKIKIFFNQFRNPLIYILLLAVIISIFLKDFVDMAVIAGAIIINTFIGYLQENKANNIHEKLKKLIKHKALVLRDGREIEIESDLITRGDIIIIKPGSRIPADGRLIEANNLFINEAALTGESMPPEKNIKVQSRGAVLSDRKNMVYAGTIVVKGEGLAVVSAIGRETELGKIAELVAETEEEKTPLQFRLLKFSNLLGAIAGIISILIVIIGVIQGRSLSEMFIMGVALAVAAIPEGLIVGVTVILALGMQKILKQKALIRRLSATETLGSITVICTDKTGTLTEGKMQVAHILIGEKEYLFSAFNSKEELEEAKDILLALKIALMCNDAIIENPEDELAEYKIIGIPTEAALLIAATQVGLNKEKLLIAEPKIGELPFEHENKFMISAHKLKNGSIAIYEKGASEKLLDKSVEFYHSGKIKKITGEEMKKLDAAYEKLTGMGLRVIGVATRQIAGSLKDEWEKNKDWKKIDNNLTFVGFIAIKDPLRAEAKETIKICRQAGIRPIIITGDHQLTARAIALEAGFRISAENIITGEALDEMSDEKLQSKIGKIDIYARVNPSHKLRIVKMLQKRGEVVAMTGDGINDSPALKQADIGISLGGGTDIAKEASDIILLDNNFKTIVETVKEGRNIFFNIRKSITFLISDSFSEVLLVAGSIIFNAPLALLPAQILWINIVIDGLPNFSLAFESNDDDIMEKKPIKKSEPIMNSQMKAIIFGAGLARDAIFLALFFYLLKAGLEIDYIRTLLLAILGIKSLMAIFSLRNLSRPIWKINFFSNAYLGLAVLVSLFFLIAAVYWRPLQEILGTTPLGFNGWIMAIAASFVGVLIIEIVKFSFIFKKQSL